MKARQSGRGTNRSSYPVYIGAVLGNWTIVAEAPRGPKGIAIWECRCECGNIKHIRQGNLIVRTFYKKITHCTCSPHLMCSTTEYRIWQGLKARCLNPRNKKYAYYGGRGIGVCEKWMSFTGFLEDMGYRPSDDHSLDRIDNDGDYCLENCRWATRLEQMNNTRRNKMLEFRGVTMSMSRWAAELGLHYGSVKSLIHKGLTLQEIVDRESIIGG